MGRPGGDRASQLVLRWTATSAGEQEGVADASGVVRARVHRPPAARPDHPAAGHPAPQLRGGTRRVVELFFSILARRLLKRGEFRSVEDLVGKVMAFIDDYNRTAMPFRWTYDGRPLKAS
jgi:hypothetical protein